MYLISSISFSAWYVVVFFFLSSSRFFPSSICRDLSSFSVCVSLWVRNAHYTRDIVRDQKRLTLSYPSMQQVSIAQNYGQVKSMCIIYEHMMTGIYTFVFFFFVVVVVVFPSIFQVKLLSAMSSHLVAIYKKRFAISCQMISARFAFTYYLNIIKCIT